MDENFSEMVKSVMSDPEALKSIMGMAQGMMGNGEGTVSESREKQEKENEEETKPTSHSIISGSNEERIALITALRPYLSDQRKKSADSLIKMLKMMKLADLSKIFRE